jgi:hypothetical protein
MRIQLGSKYRDKITKREGIATSRTEYLTGAPNIGLEREGDAHIHYFKEDRLELIQPQSAPTQ